MKTEMKTIKIIRRMEMVHPENMRKRRRMKAR